MLYSFSNKLSTLNNAEKYWTWKFGIRVAMIVLSIIAIGCVGYLINNGPFLERWYYTGGYDTLPDWALGSVITLSVSLAYCLLMITIPFMLKPVRPLHPGIAIGMELCFCGAFLTIGLFTIFAVTSAVSFGQNGFISDWNYFYGRNYSGEYNRAANGTWVYHVQYIYGGTWNATSRSYDLPEGVSLSNFTRVCSPRWTSCAEQDQYINNLYDNRQARVASTVIVNVVQWLGACISFALFVWACVDTHRLRRRNISKQKQAIAEEIVADLEKRGILSVADGTVKDALHSIAETTDKKDKKDRK